MAQHRLKAGGQGRGALVGVGRVDRVADQRALRRRGDRGGRGGDEERLGDDGERAAQAVVLVLGSADHQVRRGEACVAVELAQAVIQLRAGRGEVAGVEA